MTDGSDKNGVAGQLGASDFNNELNRQSFLFHQMLGRVATVRLVKIKKIKAGKAQQGQPPAPGQVDIQMLVNQVDGVGKSTEHGTTHNLQFVRWQAGTSAIVSDPVEGDIGIALVADRDTSSVIKKKDKANPGSNRRFDISDGVYIGTILSDAPKQFVWFTPSKNQDGTGGSVTVADGNGNVITQSQDSDKKSVTTIIDGNGNVITSNKDGITLQTKDNSGNVFVKGHVKATGNVTAGDGTSDSVTLQSHTHASGPTPDPGH